MGGSNWDYLGEALWVALTTYTLLGIFLEAVHCSGGLLPAARLPLSAEKSRTEVPGALGAMVELVKAVSRNGGRVYQATRAWLMAPSTREVNVGLVVGLVGTSAGLRGLTGTPIESVASGLELVAYVVVALFGFGSVFGSGAFTLERTSQRVRRLPKSKLAQQLT